MSDVDTWKYYDITHREQTLCNPIGDEKMNRVIELLDLPPASRVLDIACGKGELLIRLAESYGAGEGGLSGTGVDISPPFIAAARRSAQTRVPKARLEWIELDARLCSAPPGGFDLACCVGGTFALDGYAETLTFLRDAVRPGGLILIGEAYWRATPEPDFLAWSGMTADQLDSHSANVETGAAMGLTPMLALASNADEWDAYETLHWYSAARYASEHPDDPDLPELLRRVERARHEYLTWGRATLGWALYLFRRPVA
jgi:SAM-dependent methyltransferase